MKIFLEDDVKGLQFDVPLSAPQYDYFLSVVGSPPIKAKDVSLTAEGLEMIIEGSSGCCDLKYTPTEGWDAFWTGFPEEEYTGRAACDVWLKWNAHCKKHNAEVLLDSIQEGELSFEDIHDIDPKMFEYPEIRDAIVDAVMNGSFRKKTSKAKPVSEEVWKLYDLASWYYLTRAEESWEDACDAACEQHPEFVPESWAADPGGSLKKTALRKMDKHPFKRHERDTRWPRDS